MSKRDDAIFLYHIWEACRNIMATLDNIVLSDFLENQEKKAAVLWYFHVMGEAAKQLSEKTTRKYSQVPWTLMARFRDKIVHHYFGIEFERVWNIAQNELPPLLEELAKIPELIEPCKKMEAKQLEVKAAALTGFTAPDDQGKELRKQIQILIDKGCLDRGSLHQRGENMTIPELVDLLLSVPEKERQKFISPQEQHRAPEQQEPSHGIDL